MYEIGLKTIKSSLCGSLKPARNTNQLVISAVTHAPFSATGGQGFSMLHFISLRTIIHLSKYLTVI